MRKKEVPEKICCEVCGCDDKVLLHYHHIVPRTELECTNSWINICVLCANCHSKHHLGSLKIIGVFPATRLPYGRILIYEIDGVKNIDIDEPYCNTQSKEMKVFYGSKSDRSDGSE